MPGVLQDGLVGEAEVCFLIHLPDCQQRIVATRRARHCELEFLGAFFDRSFTPLLVDCAALLSCQTTNNHLVATLGTIPMITSSGWEIQSIKAQTNFSAD